MPWLRPLGLILLLAAGSMASARPFPSPKAEPPSPAELRQYVQSHWYAVGFDLPPASDGARSEQVEFVSLANDKCMRKDRRLFSCRFDATGRTTAGLQVTQSIEILLSREISGALNQVYIIQGD